MTSTTSEEEFWTTELANVGLPVKRAYKETFDTGEIIIQAEFTRGLTDVENNLFLSLTNPSAFRKKMARINAANIPQWATWTEEEILDWFQTNITTPLDATLPAMTTATQIRNTFLALVDIMKKQNTAQIANARMTAALRDENWPPLG